MKRLLFLIAAILAMFMLASCSGGVSTDSNETDPPVSTESEDVSDIPSAIGKGDAVFVDGNEGNDENDSMESLTIGFLLNSCLNR